MNHVFLALLLLSPFSAAAADSPAYQLESENCLTDATIANAKTGKLYPASYGRVDTKGNVLTWKDGAKKFTLTADTSLIIGLSNYQVTAKETTQTSPEGANPSIALIDSKLYSAVLGASTLLKAQHITSSSLQKSQTDFVISDITPKAPHQADIEEITADLPGGVNEVITIALGANPPTGMIHVLKSKADCEYGPQKIEAVKWAGFFAKVKPAVDAFDAKFRATLAAEKAYSDCEAARKDTCESEQAASSKALAERDAVWAALFKVSDFHAPKPVRHGSPSQGGSGSGGGYYDGGGNDDDGGGESSPPSYSGGHYHDGIGHGDHGGHFGDRGPGFGGGHEGGGHEGGGNHFGGGDHSGGGQHSGGGGHMGGGSEGGHGGGGFGGGGHSGGPGPSPGGGGGHGGGGHRQQLMRSRIMSGKPLQGFGDSGVETW